MIENKKDLKETLRIERAKYVPAKVYDRIVSFLCYNKEVPIWKYQKLLRKTEYHYNNKRRSLWHSLNYLFYRRRKNRLGSKLGIEIWENSFAEGMQIHHSGNIVVNGMARIGKNCQLHGSNCIGNDGKSLDAPVIGDNVEIGVGAKIIGGIRIADNIIIGGCCRCVVFSGERYNHWWHTCPQIKVSHA